MKKILEIYLRQPWEKKTIYLAFALSLLPIGIGLLIHQTPAESESQGHGRRAQVDTFIPKGFVLVPIEVQNYEALDSILGQFGVVDLFQATSPENPRQHLVARNVRILRAPQNPSHFAVLVEEAGVGGILKNSGAFNVIVKRPEKAGTEFVNEDLPARRSIVYEKD